MGDFQHAFNDEAGLQQTLETLKNVKSFNIILTYGGGKWDGHTYIPRQMHPILDCSPMRDEAKYYWWRAVSATYMARPNADTLRLLAKYHTLPIHDYGTCAAMFVRHGDKGIEMKLLDFSVYAVTAQEMWNAGLFPSSAKFLKETQDKHHLRRADGNNPDAIGVAYRHNWSLALTSSSDFPSNGTLFITTEDPAVLTEAEKWGALNHWLIAYTNLFDRAQQTAYKTWDEQHKKGSKPVHDDLEYISMLLNLQYALQCEAWVCTLASNSCRIIDELRATIGGKANRYYADLSGESCTDPPCIEDHGKIVNFGERMRKRIL